ncbi:DUF6427 family protein [Sungkyunkwania multivorans]|uniref:DUF6427 family protein n=1 Tax=Sungkyunkwania multivorans TaxID=1173618 RepID=A0ABW3D0G5_9FLAO
MNLIIFGIAILLLFIAGFIIEFPRDTQWVIYLKAFISFVALLFSVFVMDFTITRNALTKKNSYALLIFVLFLGLFPSIFVDFKMITAHLFVILGLRRFISLATGTRIEQKMFDGSFWMAIASLISEWAICFFIIAFAALFVFKLINFRFFFMPIIAYAVVSFLFFTYCYTADDLSLFMASFEYELNLEPEKYRQWQYLVPLMFCSILGGIAFVVYIIKSTKRTGLRRNINAMVMVIFFTSILAALLAEGKNGSELLWILFPLAVIIANWIERIQKEWLKESLLLASVILPVLLLVLYFIPKG